MIEEGSRVLTECNGAIRGMDPDGRIQANAKHKSASREASPEEHHLAEQLKEVCSTRNLLRIETDNDSSLDGSPRPLRMRSARLKICRTQRRNLIRCGHC